MKIALLAVNRFTSPTGICRYAANLARALSNAPEVAEVSLVVGAWQYDYFASLLGPGNKVNVIQIDLPNTSIKRNLWYWRSAARLATRLGVDVLHCSFPVPIGRMGFPGSIVTAVHDFYAFDCPENFGFPNVLFNRAFCRKALRTSDAVSVDSRATMSALQRLFPEFAASRVAAVVPCCVNFDSVVPEQPSKIHSLAESSFVLSVAQHRENKNLALLLEAFGSLKAKTTAFQKLQLLIVGAPGPETERITELARRLAPGSVIFVSGLSDQELAWLYRKCRMLVVPSSQEGFCFPAVEGMHFGARIVCSDIPVLREVGSGQCTYFDLKQGQEALCNAMARTLTLPEGSVDYGDALIRFQPEVVALQQINLYRRIRQASNIILTSEDSRQETERITQEQC